MISVVDTLGRSLTFSAPARRVVSLVPSETESVYDIAGEAVLVGCTDFCEEPRGIRDRVVSVGGTKKFDVDRVASLEPDLVLANKEENGRKLVEALIARGLPVHVSFPLDVEGAIAWLGSLCRLLGVDPSSSEPVRRARDAYEARRVAQGDLFEAFVAIWMEPLMTFDGRTFASDLLSLCGARNVFADRPRRYPLGADLGRAEPAPPERVGDRDTRYPRLSLEELVRRDPDAVLLPDEPHRFTDADADVFRRALPPHEGRPAIELCSGKDLFWYGTRLAGSIARLTALIDRLRRSVRAPS